MRNKWRWTAAVLGAAMLVVCQSGTVEVRAEEESEVTAESEQQEVTEENNENLDKEASTLSEEKEDDLQQVEPQRVDEQEAVNTAGETENDSAAVATAQTEENAQVVETETKTEEIMPVTDLRWENGKAVFYNPNTSKVYFDVHLFKDGQYPGGTTTTTSGEAESAGDVSVDMSYQLEKYGEGNYTFQVVTYNSKDHDHSLNGSGVVSEEKSEDHSYSSDNSDQDDRTLLAPTDLTWNETTGEGSFYNPNEKASLVAYVYYGSGNEYVGGFYDDKVHSKGQVTYDLYHLVEGYGQEGEYTFKVEAVYWNGDVRVMSEQSSGSFSYTKPTKKLPKPDITVTENGIISCEVSGVEEYTLGTDYGIGVDIYRDDEKIFNGGVNSLEMNFGKLISEGHTYLFRVRTMSRNINGLLSSDWAEYILDLRTEEESSSQKDRSSSSSSDSEESAEVVYEEWKPITPDEIKRYAAYSKEAVQYTADEKNAYSVTINNAMQGKMCFDSFESVLDDWKIGRTYNILPSGKLVYQMESKARITLNIPKALQANNREFKMICVTEKGRPVVLDDIDTSAETITFETDSFYAFALVYRDTAAAK